MTMYKPRICYANYITNDDITVSTNTGTKTRLIDRNAERQWVSTSGDETATITIALTQEIDTIALFNTNADEFTIKYDTSTDFDPVINDEATALKTFYIVDSSNNYLVDNSTEYIVADGFATLVNGNMYFKFDAVTPSTNVTISITTTTNGEAVRIGQIFIGKEIHEITASGSQRIPTTTKQYIKELSDGAVNKVYVRNLNAYELTLNNVSPQERANLRQLYDINKRESFFYIARPSTGDDVFDGLADHVDWVNEFDFNDYYNDLQVNGFTGIIRMKTCGGIK